MNSEPDTVQPPRVAAWLIGLFAPVKEKESILGDLLEEFSLMVAQSGAATARSWFWRHSLKTAGHLLVSEFIAAPWLIVFLMIAGLWLIGFATRASEQAMRQFLDAHSVYEFHPEAYLFWYKFPLELGRVVLCVVIGGLAAIVARRKELAAVFMLACVEMALFAVATFAVILSGREWLHWFSFMLLWNGLCALAIIGGGALIKWRRTTSPRSLAA